MVNAGADWSKPVDEYTLGTGVRFYFNKTGIYLGGGLDWNRFRWSGGKHQTDWGLGIEAGYAFDQSAPAFTIKAIPSAKNVPTCAPTPNFALSFLLYEKSNPDNEGLIIVVPFSKLRLCSKRDCQ